MTMINLSNYNTYNGLKDISVSKEGINYIFTLVPKLGKTIDVFLPNEVIEYKDALLLSYYAWIKLSELHIESKKYNLLVFKNFHYSNDLISFNHELKKYSYTNSIDTYEVPEEVNEKIRDIVIDLNLDLIKCKYKNSGSFKVP